VTEQLTFHVKNFDRLQHYKDRSPPWIKLYNGLLDDYEFGRLQDASKAHLLAIGLLASRYSNKIPLDAEWIARRINATSPIDLPALIKSGFIIPDQDCSNLLAECVQNARPERETETQVQTEKETEKKEKVSPANGHAAVPRATASASEIEGFSDWYAAYPVHKDRGHAVKAYALAKKRGTSAEELLRGAQRYASINVTKDKTYLKHPSTWLNGECWLDDVPPTPEELRMKLEVRVAEVFNSEKARQMRNLKATFGEDVQRALDKVEEAAKQGPAPKPEYWLNNWFWNHGPEGISVGPLGPT